MFETEHCCGLDRTDIPAPVSYTTRESLISGKSAARFEGFRIVHWPNTFFCGSPQIVPGESGPTKSRLQPTPLLLQFATHK
jgi:hypothetical protein